MPFNNREGLKRGNGYRRQTQTQRGNQTRGGTHGTRGMNNGSAGVGPADGGKFFSEEIEYYYYKNQDPVTGCNCSHHSDCPHGKCVNCGCSWMGRQIGNANGGPCPYPWCD